ncbi:MAG: YraN family protein [Rubrobacter sp.]|nr:YraN family protein [Rubrobacter sp.]
MQGAPSQLRRGRRLTSQSSGAWGENLALRYLTRRGYTLVERNYRTRYGEIDLIVRKDDALVFVEVKLRRGTGFGDPLEAVTLRKQSAIRSLATHYISDRNPTFDTLRFDAIGILASADKVRIRHVQDAF